MEDQENEGLCSHYDTIIVGTGLTESLLACVIAKNGHSVLQFDSNDFYGKSYASHSLNSMFSICRMQENERKSAANSESDNLAANCKKSYIVIDFYDPTTVPDASTSSAASVPVDVVASTDNEELIHEPSHLGPIEEKPCDHPLVEEGEPFTSAESAVNSKVKSLTLLSRRFVVDFPSTGLIFSTGKFVDFLVKSNTANYLEFQSLDGLYYLQTKGNNSPANATPGTELFSVPCSKGDVFKSSLLSVLEKRTLMKFLQEVADWGRSESGIEVQTLNEVDLAQGRSLHRPQNKEIASAAGDVNLATFAANKTFQELLDHFKLSPKLQQIVCHSLCFYSSSVHDSISARQGLDDLSRHLMSIGRFGDSAFLTPFYGVGELSQAFCRMCAVWGGIYILRRSIASFEPLSYTVETAVSDAENQPPVAGSIDNDSRNPVKRFEVIDSEGHKITCSHLVFNQEELPSAAMAVIHPTERYILSHTAIFDAPLILEKAKAVIIVPPKCPAIENDNAIFVVQLDSSVAVVPDGFAYISVSTEVQGRDDERCKSMIVQILNSLTTSSKAATQPNQLCFATVLRPLHHRDFAPDDYASQPHLGITRDEHLVMTPEGHLEEAQSIFERMFPGEAFVKVVTESMDHGGDDDKHAGEMDAETERDFKQLESTLQSLQTPFSVVPNSSDNSFDVDATAEMS